jgi:thiol-disulfide isomerase/thioredoxin
MKLNKSLLTLAALAAVFTVFAVACGNGNPLNAPTQVVFPSTPTPQPVAPDATNTPAIEPTKSPPLPNFTPGQLEVHNIDGWLNSEAISITDTIAGGQIVLVDFWTYTCVNCLRTLPFLRDWHAKYADRGLVILGVHTPEFEFEKDYDNVKDAIEREGIGWPVALDNDFGTWNSFANRYWPAKYLIGSDGQLTYRHFGEGGYIETEEAIRETLTEAGWDVSDIPLGGIEPVERDPYANRLTRELYGGYERNYTQSGLYAGQEGYYIAPDATREYLDAGDYTPQQWYLHGLWTNGPESIMHARTTTDLEDYIAFEFVGRSANVVLSPTAGKSFNVYVEIDDRPLTQDEAGIDILFDDQGRSYFSVDEPRLYAFLETPKFGQHIVKLASDSDDFAIFAFTFGIYESGI